MDFSTLIGSFGVALLLIAFFLNLFKFISEDNVFYMLLNIAGAGISCYASWLIHFMPFVILEAIWSIVALAALIRKMLKNFSKV